MPTPSVFGERLRLMRRQREWTQEDLANASGISAQMISHFETGTRQKASADNLVNLARALRCSVDYLLGQADHPELSDPRARSVFRRLSSASDETIEQAVNIVDALLAGGQDRKERKRSE